MVLVVFLNIYWHTEDSLNIHISQGTQSTEAMRMIKKIYPDETLEA
jgi:hypothetical protein